MKYVRHRGSKQVRFKSGVKERRRLTVGVSRTPDAVSRTAPVRNVARQLAMAPRCVSGSAAKSGFVHHWRRKQESH